MDRTRTWEAFRQTAMCAFGSFSFELLLPAEGEGEAGEPAADAEDRRVLPEASLFRFPADETVAEGAWMVRERKAGSSADASYGTASPSARPTYVETCPGAQGVSVSFAGAQDRVGGPGLVCGHHLRADAPGISVPASCDGLVHRYVLAWELSNSLEAEFCVMALEEALGIGTPSIFNTDQGRQFTSEEFTGRLQAAGVQISMEGRGRVMDNLFVERLWRTVKYEEVYLKDYPDGVAARQGLERYFRFYNSQRRQQGLRRRTPAEVYLGIS